eukprot:TRINITY_DN528_c0_g1_i4.p1 TRINITY_DN528_c0_g1~~TRINITY_DN528_c0_g1_i4.p1  ORF type:complete len:312 (+),score=107.91 TRINITY_DN528_c0_g1_i4:65-1000(+)
MYGMQMPFYSNSFACPYPYPYPCEYPTATPPPPVDQPCIDTQDLAKWGATPTPSLPCLNNKRGVIAVPKLEPQHRPRILKGRCLDCGKIAQPSAVKCSCGGEKKANSTHRALPPAKVTEILARREMRHEEQLEAIRHVVQESGMRMLELAAVVFKHCSDDKDFAKACARLCQGIGGWGNGLGGDFKRGLRCVCKEGLGNIMQAVQFKDDSKSECSSSSGGYGVVMDKNRMGNVLGFIGQLYLKGLVEGDPVMECMHSLVELSEEGVSLALELLIPFLRVTSPMLSTTQPYHGQLAVINKRLQVLQSDMVGY